MTFEQAVGVTFVRAIVVAASATAIGWRVATVLSRDDNGVRRLWQRVLLVMLFALFLMPNVVVGYAWSGGGLSLARLPVANECLYVVLLIGKLLPLATGIVYFVPGSGLSAQGVYLMGMLPTTSALGRNRLTRFIKTIRFGPRRSAVIAFGVVFVFAFQEFELAALLYAMAGRQVSAGTWVYKLHEYQQLYVPMGQVLSKAGIALLIEIFVVGCAVALVWGSWKVPPAQPSGQSFRSVPVRLDRNGRFKVIGIRFAVCFAIVAFAMNVFVPLIVVVGNAAGGAIELSTRFRLGDELIASVFVAVFVTAFTLALVALLLSTRAWKRTRLASVVGLSALGLIGPLMLSVFVLEVFTLPLLAGLADTPVRLIVGMIAWVLPIAILIRLAAMQDVSTGADHNARLLRESRDANQRRAGFHVWLVMHGKGWFGLGMLVFVLAYFELAMSVTLSASRMTPMIVELYNQMHYGQRALLSATVVVALICPVLLLGAAIGCRKMIERLV